MIRLLLFLLVLFIMQSAEVQASQGMTCCTNNGNSTLIFRDFNTISGCAANANYEFNSPDFTAITKRNLYPAYSFNVLKKVFYAELKKPSAIAALKIS